MRENGEDGGGMVEVVLVMVVVVGIWNDCCRECVKGDGKLNIWRALVDVVQDAVMVVDEAGKDKLIKAVVNEVVRGEDEVRGKGWGKEGTKKGRKRGQRKGWK